MPFRRSALAVHSSIVTKLRSALCAASSAWCSSGISSQSSGIPLLDGLVRKYRTVPVLSPSFETRRRLPPRRVAGSSTCLAAEVPRSLVDLGSPVNLGSGSLRSVASAVSGEVAPIICSPLHGIALRLACLSAHEPLSPHPSWFSSRVPPCFSIARPRPWLAFNGTGSGEIRNLPGHATEIDQFFAPSISALDCSNPLSFSPTICRSPYSATRSPLGTRSERSVCSRRML